MRMKPTHCLYSLFLVLLVTASCKKDDPVTPVNDPPLTSANHITFALGNQHDTIQGGAHFTDSCHFMFDNVIEDIFMTLPADLQEGSTYSFGTPEATLAFSNDYLLKMWYSSSGTVTITMKDTTAKILRGVFDVNVYNDGTVISPQGYPGNNPPSTLHLENGTFDVHYSE
jgi:hypothetical protein